MHRLPVNSVFWYPVNKEAIKQHRYALQCTCIYRRHIFTKMRFFLFSFKHYVISIDDAVRTRFRSLAKQITILKSD